MKTFIAIILTFIFSTVAALAQTTTFTYQGRISDGGATANGSYDLQFALYDEAGTQIGAATAREDVTVSNGIFTVQLDFGANAFPGANRFLEIGVRRGSETGAFVILTPRQPVTATPYAIRALNASNAEQLGGIAATNYLQTNGNGENLTNLNASSIAAGTLTDARLSANVALRNSANTFAGDQTINGNFAQSGTTANLFLNNGFVVRGTFGSGLIPIGGAGARMMYSPYLAVFRAGRVTGNQWDFGNIGNNSAAFGLDTTAGGNASFAAGIYTSATGPYSTAFGFATEASGESSLAIGSYVSATGAFTTALGRSAWTNGQSGSFVFGDNSLPNGGTILTAAAPNSWSIRASGGYRFFTSPDYSTGVSLSAGGGAWNSISDRNVKDNITPVNSREILRGVLSLPISTWNYKTQPQFRHIGAMAQDFYSTFKVGEDDKRITTIDPDGVALAAIQGLHEELKDRDREIERQRQQLTTLREQVKRQETTLDNLKRLICEQNTAAEACK